MLQTLFSNSPEGDHARREEMVKFKHFQQGVDSLPAIMSRLVILTALGGLALIWADWRYVAVSWLYVVMLDRPLRVLVARFAFRSGTRRIGLFWMLVYSALLGFAISFAWIAPLLSAKPAGLILGVGGFAAAAIPAAFFSSTMPFVLAGVLGPSFLFFIACAFFLDLPEYGGVAMLVAAILLMAVIALAMSDRHYLMRAARENEQARLDAERANLAKSQFLATITHELRTPLNAVIGYAEIIEEDLRASAANAASAADDAARINRAAHSLLSMIDDVIQWSSFDTKNQSIKVGDVDLGALVHEVAAPMRQRAVARNNTLTVQAEPVLIATDAAHVRKCLVHLLDNAVKYTENGAIALRVAATADGAEIHVIDNGCGMDAETAARIFRPFEQGDDSLTRRHGGAGLGLALVREISGLLGGDVTVSSQPGKGAHFTLRIASFEMSAPAAAAA